MTALETPRFLLIDDDPINNMISSKLINKISPKADIIMFTEPVAGLQYIKSNSLQGNVNTVLFLDLNMPVLTGWDVLDELTDIQDMIQCFFKTYILSSSNAPVDQKRAKTYPIVCDFIVKPLTLFRLQELLK